MTVTPRTFTAVLGAAALLVGLAAVLFVSVSASHAGGMLDDYDCGTVVAPRVGSYGGEYLQACTDALGARALWGWALVVVGGLVLLGVLVVRSRPARSPK